MQKVFTVTLPDIGEGVVEGEVIQWLKNENDPLLQDEPVVVVMTDKATVELPAPYPGKLLKQYYKPGQTAIVNKPLYDIELSQPLEIVMDTKESIVPIENLQHEKQKKEEIHHDHHALAAPKTRHLAHELGVHLNEITGTGKEGRITDQDVIAYHAHHDNAEKEMNPLIGIPHLMAKRMALSKKTIPHFSYFEQLDATRLVQLRNHYKEEAAKEGITATYIPFIIKALSLTLTRFPIVNGSYDAEQNQVVQHPQHNVGIAINTEQGLIVPVLKNVNELTLKEIILKYDDLIERALNNRLDPKEMKDGTVTISNYGVLAGGGLWATPIINPPESAILAIGKIHKAPFVRNDELVVRDILNLSWSFDHRIIDGNLAANFSHYFATLLQNPAPLID